MGEHAEASTDSFMTTFTTRTRERTLDMRAQTHAVI
jgi:hypothetical protein